MILKAFKANNNKIIKDINSNKANEIIKNLFKFKKLKNKKFKNLTYIKNMKKIHISNF